MFPASLHSSLWAWSARQITDTEWERRNNFSSWHRHRSLYFSRRKDEQKICWNICPRVNGLQGYCRKVKTIIVSSLSYWDPESNNFIFNLVTKTKFFEQPTLDNLRISLENMSRHALLNNITKITMPKNGCRSDKLQRTDVFKFIQDIFT